MFKIELCQVAISSLYIKWKPFIQDFSKLQIDTLKVSPSPILSKKQ